MADKLIILKRYNAVLTVIFVFIVYLFTVAPSVVQIDSGELASVQKTMGITHPTGYPLFTLIGYLFINIPLPFSDIYKANLLAALFCSLGIYLFIKSAQLLSKESLSHPNQSKKLKAKHLQIVQPKENETAAIILPAILGALILAFSKTYWVQSTSTEVYPLQVFLFNLIIFTTIKVYFSDSPKIYSWIWVSISLALGFANHMTTLLILPLIAILFFSKEKFTAEAFKKLAMMFAVFVPVLVLLYLYLPLRASTNPEVNWGNVINFENFWRHFTGKQYQVWLFSSFDSARKQLVYFLGNMPSEFAYAGLIIIFTGIGHSYKISKKIFFCLAVTLIFAVLYSINYDIVDIDSYFLLAYIVFSFFSVFGFRKILVWFSKKKYFAVASVILPAVIIIEIAVNYSTADQSDVHIFEDYTIAILKSTEPNSVIFTYQWDYFISPAYYFQHVEGIRKDVAIIDKELLRRSWYYNQMNRNYPWVVQNVKHEINAFLEALKPFERDEVYDADLLEKNYRAIMTNLVSGNFGKRNFYFGLELFQNEMQRGEFTLPAGYQFVPHLLMFKVVKGNEYVPVPDPDFIIRIPSHGNKYTLNIENFAATMLSYRAVYELQFGKVDRAKVYVDKIKSNFPSFMIPPSILQKLNGG